MTKAVLSDSFWKPGSSGKHTERAREAGVVGTFGIGAMANFGVCDRLVVETESIEDGKRWKSTVLKNELKIGEQCIPLDPIPNTGTPGTRITAQLLPSFPLDETAIIRYLSPYVENLPIIVRVGDDVISQKPKSLPDTITPLGEQTASDGYLALNLTIGIAANNQVCVSGREMTVQGEQLIGELTLHQGTQRIMAQCNSFGLSEVPVNSHYSWGGTINMSMLRPTAGREALSRESVTLITRLVNLVDKAVSEALANREECDSNGAFLNYVNANHRIDLSNRVSIQVLPGANRIQLGKVPMHVQDKSAQWYGGRNQETINAYTGIDTPLLLLDHGGSRRGIQQRYITTQIGIPQASDEVKEKRRFPESEISIAEISFLIKLTTTLVDDYGFSRPDVYFAEFSHLVPFIVSSNQDKLRIAIRRDSSETKPVIECYQQAREVFDGVVKDFVRIHLYARLQQFVPTSTRLGADAFIAMLRKNREKFRYEESEFFSLEEFLAQIGLSKENAADVMGRRPHRSHPQLVTANQVANADIIHRSQTAEPAARNRPQPGETAPPIRRPDVDTLNVKIIVANADVTELNGYHMLLSLSNRTFQREREFFYQPHSTKVIWGGHRIVFIFTLASGELSFYYDVDLRVPIDAANPGGEAMITSTVITKNRIFVPVPDAICPTFKVEGGQVKEFSVRYDTILTKR